MHISQLGPYKCTKLECKRDNHHKLNVEWGYHNDTDGTKNGCQLRCTNDPDCESFEWSDYRCTWWKKGMCQGNEDAISKDRKFVMCKKIGTLSHQSFSKCKAYNYYLSIVSNY